MERVIDFALMTLASVVGLLLATYIHMWITEAYTSRKRKKRNKSK